MKILLTGEPHVGKSTLLCEVVSSITDKCGFVTAEVTDGEKRTGFELVSAGGNKSLLASVSSESEIRVSRYGVNLEDFEDFLALLEEPVESSLLYIDEIGQMELFSDKFKMIVEEYLARPNPFIGTITSVYSDDFTSSLMSRSDIEIVHLTFENRDSITAEIKDRVAKFVY